MKIDYPKMLLFGLLTFVILLILAIYSFKLSLHFIVNDEEDVYDGFRISEIEDSDSVNGENNAIEMEENH
ncbi:MAG: hypothetical protein C0P75_010840 [Bacilli bacterium]|uniref:Uncharacterized protein n=1 Tax=Ureibacillus suwonensis TaxID=313007 RepID=A0ABW0RB34_9BACL|nr:hypothetical protein [Bacilli bacterium]